MVRCAVPFCQRTTDYPCAEWICGRHWDGVSPNRRTPTGERGWIEAKAQAVLSAVFAPPAHVGVARHDVGAAFA